MRTVAGVVAIILLTAGCGEGEPSAQERAESQQRIQEALEGPRQEVMYEVEGTAESVSITVETPTGTSQQQGLAVPLAPEGGGVGQHGLTFQFAAGDFVYIAAQNEGEYGKVTCRITAGDTVISENTASGAYAIATCKGSA